MTASPLRLGILGCGAVACSHHLPALRKVAGAELVALADPDPEARSRAGRLAPGAGLHADAEEVLARADVDAVVVAAPPALHAGLASAAAAAGKHVYLEKPLATGEPEGSRVLDDVARAGVVAAMGFNRRSHPVYQQARELVGREELGAVRFVRTSFCEPVDPVSMPEWKRRRAAGGGVLLDLGSHHFDLLRWFLRAELEVVHARTRTGLTDQDEALVEISTSTGVEIQCLFSFRAAHADFVEVFGELGRLRVDRHRGALLVQRLRRSRYGIRRAWLPTAEHALTWRSRRLLDLRGDPSFARALAAFVRRAGGAEVETPSLRDGLKSLQTVLAAEHLSESATLPSD